MKNHPHFWPIARPLRGSAAALRRQRGAIIITVALALLFLLGFMGFALDFGRLFVVKTELQTATDSCALAAAQELDGASDALTRAVNAGRAAGNLNRVHFQGASAGIAASDISFSKELYPFLNTTPSEAKYAKCERAQTGIMPWLLQALGAFSGNDSYKQSNSVFALGVATRSPAQTNCALPIGICSKPGGYQKGEWIPGAVNANEAVTGQFRWLDFTGNGGGARELKDLLRGAGQCNLPGNDTTTGKPGNNGSAADAYNSRFGFYLGSKWQASDGVPDMTGYSWYLDTAPTQPPYPNKYAAFIEKRQSYARYQGDGQTDVVGLQTTGKFNTDLAANGASRRVAPMPIVNCAAFDGLSGNGSIKISDWACVLLLHPIKKGAGPNSTKMWLEYLGLASDLASPCSTSGLPGGASGPLVPVLVQ